MVYIQNKKETTAGYDKRRTIVLTAYGFIMLLMAVMIFSNVLFKSRNDINYGLREFFSISGEWTDENGKAFDFSEIDSYKDAKEELIYAYYQLGDLTYDTTIAFRSKNTYVTVSIDGKILYATEIADAPFYNHSPGTRWNMVNIGEEHSGQTVVLEIKQAYEDGRAKVDNFYIGDRVAIVLSLISDKMLGIFICILILGVGIMYLLGDFVLNKSRNIVDHSLLYLGTFSTIAGIWCLLETNILQLFSENLRLIQVVDNMMLVIGAVPFYLYLDSVYHIFKNKIMLSICIIDMVYVGAATVSQMCGGPDFHQTLNGAIVNYGVIVLIIIITLNGKRKQLKKDGEVKQNKIIFTLQQAGISFLGLALAGDLIRYMSRDVMDRAFIMRIGLLVFIICFGSGNIYRMIQLVKQGMQAELIAKLAYSDGLTEVGNRTAYMEKLQEYIKNPGSGKLGIVMFDINNLKWTNDHMGHQSGDALIRLCVKVIEKSFGKVGKTYRIGGDEFIVLIQNENPKRTYESMYPLFIAEMEKTNQTQQELVVSIAHGAAFCGELTEEEITKAESTADRNMYQNKAEMKQRESE